MTTTNCDAKLGIVEGSIFKSLGWTEQNEKYEALKHYIPVFQTPLTSCKSGNAKDNNELIQGAVGAYNILSCLFHINRYLYTFSFCHKRSSWEYMVIIQSNCNPMSYTRLLLS